MPEVEKSGALRFEALVLEEHIDVVGFAENWPDYSHVLAASLYRHTL